MMKKYEKITKLCHAPLIFLLSSGEKKTRGKKKLGGDEKK